MTRTVTRPPVPFPPSLFIDFPLERVPAQAPPPPERHLQYSPTSLIWPLPLYSQSSNPTSQTKFEEYGHRAWYDGYVFCTTSKVNKCHTIVSDSVLASSTFF
jgi:hypothetical protein